MKHHCEFTDKSGWTLVEIARGVKRTYCEVGANCVKECPYSYKPTSAELMYVGMAFSDELPEMPTTIPAAEGK